MSEEVKKEPEKAPEDQKPTVEDLTKQIENLNKGIGKYRDEAKQANQKAEALEKKYADLEKTISDKEVKKEDLPDLSPEDAKRLEKWAKAQGFVTKAEAEAQKTEMQREAIQSVEKQAIDDFIASHPEYEDDEKWNAVKAEFSVYKQPTTAEGFRKVLNKIHADLNPDDSKARAEALGRSRLSLGGGSQKGNEAASEVEKLREKYPNLSSDQIQARLKEIKSIFPKKED